MCLRCKGIATIGNTELGGGYCEKCANKILAAAMLMDLHKVAPSKARSYSPSLSKKLKGKK